MGETRERKIERAWNARGERDEKGAVESATRVAWGAEESSAGSSASTNQSITSPHATLKGRWADI